MILIGDVHGKYSEYLDIIHDVDCSIQLGDFGFNYNCLRDVDASRHKLIKGNHDNYAIDIPHDLGNYGILKHHGCNLFYVRGGFSIDYKRRLIGRDWFPQEELNLSQQHDCIDLYCKMKPDILLSHEPPYHICSHFPDTGILKCFGYHHPLQTVTNSLLTYLIQQHKPKLHVFAHMHRSLYVKQNGTEYRCLNELETYQL